MRKTTIQLRDDLEMRTLAHTTPRFRFRQHSIFSILQGGITLGAVTVYPDDHSAEIKLVGQARTTCSQAEIADRLCALIPAQ